MNWIADFSAVAIGGCIGAMARYGITIAATQPPLASLTGGASHVGTTIANLLGCLALGVLYQWGENLAASGVTPFGPRTMLALRVGLLGSLTTFSTLIGETSVLTTTGRPGAGLGLMAVNLVGGWLLFFGAVFTVRELAT